MKRIYLIRHGETEYNRKGIIQGSGVDMPLNSMGIKQAKAFYDYYNHIDFDVAIHSNLIRSKQTIMPFIDSLNTPSIELPEIREISWGTYEGKSYSPSLRKNYDAMLSNWASGNLDAKLEGGESAAELFERVSNGIKFILGLQEKKILVCSHGRTIRAMMCVFNGLAPSNMEQYEHSNTGLYLLHHENLSTQVISINDTTHLQEIFI